MPKNQDNELIILSRIVSVTDHSVVKGFVALGMDDGGIYRMTLDDTEKAFSAYWCHNAKWDAQYKTLVGIGTSLYSYPSMDTKGVAIDKDGFTASHIIVDEQTGDEIGAVLFDLFGRQFNANTARLIKFREEGRKFTNFTVDALGHVSPVVKGYSFAKIKMKSIGKRAGYNSANGETASPITNVDGCPVPYINVSGFDNIENSSYALSAQDSMFAALNNLKKLSPYYYSLLSSIKRTPVEGLGTLAVDEKDLYYDVQYVTTLRVDELTFILIHELMHILMRHSLRGKGKIHDLWNTATDLYINETIRSEWGLENLDETVEVTEDRITGSFPNLNIDQKRDPKRGYIRAQKDGLYASKFGITIDLATETPETIYAQMLEENPNFNKQYTNSNKNQKQGNGGGGGQSVPLSEILKAALKCAKNIKESAKRGYDEARKSSDGGSQNACTAINSDANASVKVLTGNETDCNIIGNTLISKANSIIQQADVLASNNNSSANAIKRNANKLKSYGEAILNASSSGGESGESQLQKGMEQAQQNCKNSQSSTQAARQIKDGIKDFNEGQRNGDENLKQQGLNQIQQGIDKMNQAQAQAGQSGTPQGNTASQNMQQGLDSMSNQQGSNGQGSDSSGTGSDSKGSEKGNKQDGDFRDCSGKKADKGEDDFGEGSGEGAEEKKSSDSAQKGTRHVKVQLKGKMIEADINDDITTSIPDKSDDGITKAIEETKKALQRAKTKLKMDEEKAGKSFSAGAGGSLVMRNIEYGLRSDLTWQKLLENVTPRKHSKAYTLAAPNKTYMNRGITMASRREIGKPSTYTGLKFCIDVSGSVSTSELEGYIADVSSIFDKYEVDGELIYWSTEIGDFGKFTDKRDALKISPTTTGGTDVRCVFDFLAGKVSINGRKEETRIRDIEAIFILTDGCFSHNYEDYKEAFGRKVVWVIDGDPIRFNPPFGKVVGLHKETN